MNVTATEPTLAETLYRIVRGRRSIRRFQPRAIPQAVLLRLLDAATWAPSAHNRQPWRFVLITDAAAHSALADAMGRRLAADLRADGLGEDAIAADVARSRGRLTGAAALVVVCLTMADMDSYPDAARQHHEHTMAVQSTAMAAQNLLLAAHAEGLGAVWMCAPLFAPEVVRAALDLPDDYEPQGVIALGVPAETRTKTRHALESRVLWR